MEHPTPLPFSPPSPRGLCWGPSTSHLPYPCSPPAIAAHRALPDSARFRHRSRSVDADGSSQPCFLGVLNPRHEHCRLPGSPAPRQPSGHLHGGGRFPQSQVQPSPSVTWATGRDSPWEGGEPGQGSSPSSPGSDSSSVQEGHGPLYNSHTGCPVSIQCQKRHKELSRVIGPTHCTECTRTGTCALLT